MSDQDILLEKVRSAIGDRALYLALLIRSFSTEIPTEQVERLARNAIYEFGRLKGQKDQQTMTPDLWVDLHVSGGGADVFNSQIIKTDKQSVQQMTYCPLMVAWQTLGCSESEMDKLCDIAMEVDRGRADYHGIPYSITERMAKGDACCRLVLKKTV